MRIPNAARATITREKLTEYLLSSDHPRGRFKSAFFRRLGYDAAEPFRLENDLRKMLAEDAEIVGRTAFGTKYRITGTIVGPTGDSAVVVTLWIILFDEQAPRFITAYPGDS